MLDLINLCEHFLALASLAGALYDMLMHYCVHPDRFLSSLRFFSQPQHLHHLHLYLRYRFLGSEGEPERLALKLQALPEEPESTDYD